MIKGKTVYLSGPMTGIENYNFHTFDHAERVLKKGGAKVVINPSRHPIGLSHAQYMEYAMLDVANADVVVLLPGWRNSKGACAEVKFAKELFKIIVKLRIQSNAKDTIISHGEDSQSD